jgi:hypothetical protein
MVVKARSDPSLTQSGALLYEEARLNRLVGRDDRAVELIGEIPEGDEAYQAAQELLHVIRPPEPEASAAASAAP